MPEDIRSKLGVTVYDRNKAYQGYTLFTQTHEDPRLGTDLWAYPTLIDMEGNVVHRWRVGTAVQLVKLQPDGTLFYMTRDRSNIDEAGLYRLAPDSSIIWSYHCRIDHDYYPLDHGNLLIHTISDYMVPRLGNELRRNPYLLEITPDKELVWEWRGDEHLDELHDLGVLELPIDWERRCEMEVRARSAWLDELKEATIEQRWRVKQRYMCSYGFDWAHNNTCQVIGENAAARKDSRFRPGNIVFSYRTLDIIGVIDRDTGEIVWAWGPGEIEGQHKPYMLPSGHILIYDNGSHRGWSRVVEMDPLTEQIIWEYVGDPKESFFSAAISGQQRLPNGNTLICEGGRGRLFEVTQDKDVVWEYQSPFRGIINGREAHNIYRTLRYSADYVRPLFD